MLVSSKSPVGDDYDARLARLESMISTLVGTHNSASGKQQGEITRFGISSTRHLGSKKARRRDPASRQLDILGPRRWEDEIRHLVNPTSWVWEGEKPSSSISSTWLLGSKKARRRDPASRQLVFFFLDAISQVDKIKPLLLHHEFISPYFHFSQRW